MLDRNIAVYQMRVGCTIKTLAEKVKYAMSADIKRAKVVYRVKNPETLRKKIQLKKGKNIFSVDDVYGIRIIVESVKDAYTALKSIRRQFPGYLADDFIAKPKIWSDPGFKGQKLRLLRFVAYENNVSFEIQIATNAFYEVNESHHQVHHKKRYF
ncbi:MAG: hypothetical protein KAR00_03150 [Candidatus Pacebacteria bacterium]|nr:hypothetical protein [Candidatus Paceibacterota bacterium]